MALPNYSMNERDMIKTPQIRGGAPNLNININGNAKLQNNININIINHNIQLGSKQAVPRGQSKVVEVALQTQNMIQQY